MDKKLAVYICSGCGIGDCLDLDQLCEVATKEYKVQICKTQPYLCGEEGSQLLRKDIEDGVNTVVIATCFLRVNYDVFPLDSCDCIAVNASQVSDYPT